MSITSDFSDYKRVQNYVKLYYMPNIQKKVLQFVIIIITLLFMHYYYSKGERSTKE